jgi:hypothetical protein
MRPGHPAARHAACHAVFRLTICSEQLVPPLAFRRPRWVSLVGRGGNPWQVQLGLDCLAAPINLSPYRSLIAGANCRHTCIVVADRI